MSPKNNIKVLIGGSVYNLSGDESEEYIQRVALYINNKMEKLEATENAKQLNTKMLSVLLAINIADDLFKVKETIKEMENELEDKEVQLKHAKQTVLDLQDDLENVNKEKLSLLSKTESLEYELEKIKQELDDYINTFDVDDE